jgi:AhpD family alkylhydroperoxidase
VNAPRLPWTELQPKAYQAQAAVKNSTAGSPLGKPLMSLMDLRVSQINGCAFCVDMHTRELRHHGEGWQRINSLSTWRETPLYSARERAALAWAEALTRLPDGHADHDAAFDGLRAHFSDAEIVDLSWTIAQINAWNRMAVGMRAPVADKPLT